MRVFLPLVLRRLFRFCSFWFYSSTRSDWGSGAGLVAELELSVVSGSGEVFLNTYPLTKLSTQLSLRVAVDQACQELLVDCSSDFISRRFTLLRCWWYRARVAWRRFSLRRLLVTCRKYSSIVMTGR